MRHYVVLMLSSTSAGVPAEVLAREAGRLLDFGRHFPHPQGGAAWLDEVGQPDLTRPVFSWITARMVHTYCLGALLGRPGDRELAAIAWDGLTRRLRDEVDGGWFTSLDSEGASPDEKACYTHAFVVLASSSATVVGLPDARTVLDEALAGWQDRFFDPASGLFADAWNRSFTVLDPYRGVNGNMHSVEALLAAADVTGAAELRIQALGIARRVALEWTRSRAATTANAVAVAVAMVRARMNVPLLGARLHCHATESSCRPLGGGHAPAGVSVRRRTPSDTRGSPGKRVARGVVFPVRVVQVRRTRLCMMTLVQHAQRLTAGRAGRDKDGRTVSSPRPRRPKVLRPASPAECSFTGDITSFASPSPMPYSARTVNSPPAAAATTATRRSSRPRGERLRR